jgi:esterase/lipase superfamily enzyme
MHREESVWHSPALNKPMEIVSYGASGFALLMIPTAASGHLEYEHNGLIEAIKPQIESGKTSVFCIASINAESWLNPYMSGHEKGVRHHLYNEYIIKEVLPFIRNKTSPTTQIYTCGASFGALHAANLFFKHPDMIHGVIGMSGCYDLTVYTDSYFDDNVYFNSPVHYLKNLNVEWHLSLYRQSNHIHFVTGSGAYERPEYSIGISEILRSKHVHHELDIWGQDIPHEWWVWKKMLPYYLDSRF